MPAKPARILIIAGSDSGGGAGIQADIKTVTMLGGHAMTAITAVTAQNTLGVQAVHLIPTEMVIAQIVACVEDIGVDAIKIGMVPTAECARAIGGALLAVRERLAAAHGEEKRPYPVPVVVDPVIVATSGARLIDDDALAAICVRILPFANLVTPNNAEGEALGRTDAFKSYQRALLLKGGHGDGDIVTDVLIPEDLEQPVRWQSPRIATTSTHGTGCTLASAIATGLGQGMPMSAAIARARDFVRLSLLDAPVLGQGHGPMGQGSVKNEALLDGPVLNQMTLPARDYAQSVDFYRLLGLTQIVDSPSNGYARFEAANGVTFSVHVDANQMPGGATIYLEMASLDAWYARLLSQGVHFEQPPTDRKHGWREARLIDPAGNHLCLYHAGEYRRFPPWRI